MNKKVLTIILEVAAIVTLVVFVIVAVKGFNRLEKTSPFDDKYTHYTESRSVETESIGYEVTTYTLEDISETESTMESVNPVQSGEASNSESDELDYLYSLADVTDEYNPNAVIYSEHDKVNYCIQNIMDACGYLSAQVIAGSIDEMQDTQYFSCDFDNGYKWFIYYQISENRAYAIKDKTVIVSNEVYEVPYKLFPYQITLGVYSQDEVLNFFDDGPTYYGLKKNLNAYGYYVLESLYNICKMYDYTSVDLITKDTDKVTGDGTLLFEYVTPEGELTLVVDTDNAIGYFITDTTEIGE